MPKIPPQQTVPRSQPFDVSDVTDEELMMEASKIERNMTLGGNFLYIIYLSLSGNGDYPNVTLELCSREILYLITFSIFLVDFVVNEFLFSPFQEGGCLLKI